MDLKKITSPTLLLNKKICLNNINQMSEKAKAAKVIFRPHFKTHQSITIGSWFRKAGVQKITVSSLQMAEYFARENWKDITVAFPVNIREINLINDLAEEIQLNITIENIEAFEFLNKHLKYPVQFFIKIDTGYNRTGIQANNFQLIDQILKLEKKSETLNFVGFLSHFGQTYSAVSKDEIILTYKNSIKQLKTLKNKFQDDYKNLIISVGDTPSCSVIQDDFMGVNEIRPGNFVFYDLMQWKVGSCNFEQIAVCMACPVVAMHIERNEIIIHGGAIHFSKETTLINEQNKFGQLVFIDENGWRKPEIDYFLTKLSQEHGTISVDAKLIKNIKIGDLVGIVPVHSCLTANLMKRFYTTDNEWIDHFSGVF
ncbi:MAG: alanine racemase [Bacteroidales bacterium]